MSGVILIIDHDTELAGALSVYLERQKFEVHLAGSEKKALEILKNTSPEIILADPNIPDTDGIGLLHRIKKSNPQTQFIIYTVSELLEKTMQTFQGDALSYIKKPVSSIALDLSLKNAEKWIGMQRKLDGYTQKLGDLHSAQTLSQQLFDEVPCYITVQDKQFRMTATNRLFKRDFGHEIGEHCYRIYKHRDTPCPDCPVAATFEDGQRHQTEEVVTSKSGDQYHVMTWTAPIRDESNQITQVMEMATNITQIRELQDHLTSLGLMLGSMSHGIKGMLTALDGGIYLLETGIDRQDPERTHRAFEQVRLMVERIRKMVLDILYFTKSRKLQYQNVDIEEMVKTLTEIIEPLALHHDIKFHTSIESLTGQIEIDPDWLRTSLVNFLENAVDACASDPEKKAHWIDFTISAGDADHICFEIKDNGLGMDQETREKMFTLFFSSKGSKGTGLGLFISNHVISQHGGTIVVESEIKSGSRFEICIPKTRAFKKTE